MTQPLFEVNNLRVSFNSDAGDTVAVDGVSFSVDQGETIGIVGESGSGKSVSLFAPFGFLERYRPHITGSAKFEGRDLSSLPRAELRSLLGAEVGFVFQDPMSSLNPVYPVGWQIEEQLRAHKKITKVAARARAAEMLDAVGIPDPTQRLHAYPHEFSGGMRQRVMIAMALSCEPKLLIADEPTTALDVTVQEQILDLISGLQSSLGLTLAIVSHDLGVIAGLADRVIVMRTGEVVESGLVRTVFTTPKHDYTRRLLAAVPRLDGATGPGDASHNPILDESTSNDQALLRAQHLTKVYKLRGSGRGLKADGLHAVKDVSLHIGAGETLAVVGESGSGKSTLARMLVRLDEVTNGSIEFEGHDITNLGRRRLRPVARHMQMVFQDPFASLNPRHRIGDIIAAPMRIQATVQADKVGGRVDELLERVGLPANYRSRYPRQLSGGERQRVSIARALSVNPRLIVADEAVSALDVSVRAEILDLFKELQRELAISYLFIAHDLGVVREFADRVAVMYQGEVVEYGSVRDVLDQPQHPYTQKLLASVPVLDPDLARERRKQRTRQATRGSGVPDEPIGEATNVRGTSPT